jgi:hypothetical protein
MRAVQCSQPWSLPLSLYDVTSPHQPEFSHTICERMASPYDLVGPPSYLSITHCLASSCRDREPVTFAFGPCHHWYQLTVYFALKQGDIAQLCPVLPSSWYAHPTALLLPRLIMLSALVSVVSRQFFRALWSAGDLLPHAADWLTLLEETARPVAGQDGKWHCCTWPKLLLLIDDVGTQLLLIPPQYAPPQHACISSGSALAAFDDEDVVAMVTVSSWSSESVTKTHACSIVTDWSSAYLCTGYVQRPRAC